MGDRFIFEPKKSENFSSKESEYIKIYMPNNNKLLNASSLSNIPFYDKGYYGINKEK
jgi:hypothetical protein